MKAETLQSLIRGAENFIRVVDGCEPDNANDDQYVFESLEKLIAKLGVEMPFDTKYNNPCLRKAAPDEPLFVVRAQDVTAVKMPLAWLMFNPHIMSPASQAYREKFEAAILNIKLIAAWQAKNKTKAAD